MHEQRLPTDLRNPEQARAMLRKEMALHQETFRKPATESEGEQKLRMRAFHEERIKKLREVLELLLQHEDKLCDKCGGAGYLI